MSSVSESIANFSGLANAAKQQVTEAFSLKESDQAGINKLGKELGAKPDSNGNYTLEGIQIEAKNNLEQRNQSISLLSALMDSINQVRQKIIGAIGR